MFGCASGGRACRFSSRSGARPDSVERSPRTAKLRSQSSKISCVSRKRSDRSTTAPSGCTMAGNSRPSRAKVPTANVPTRRPVVGSTAAESTAAGVSGWLMMLLSGLEVSDGQVLELGEVVLHEHGAPAARESQGEVVEHERVDAELEQSADVACGEGLAFLVVQVAAIEDGGGVGAELVGEGVVAGDFP